MPCHCMWHSRFTVSLAKTLLPSHLSITLLIASSHVRKIFLQYCFTYVLSLILSDPSELSVNWSAKTEQLLKCSTAEEYQSFLLSLLSSSFYHFPLNTFLYLSFILFVMKRRLLDISDWVLVIITELFILAKLKINCD